ncbi:ArnT family glycosyltransferase [Coleofasciculus sp. H7-2]|uniref:ArnT family glycosyltransferase n=1 Tax=Coleofasciculus sp. H7-2 TaxID=3351545 RepID=UPI00366F1037
MFVFLPIVSFILLVIIFKKHNGWRSSLLAASVVWGFLLTGITEIFSLFKLITFSGLFAGWLFTSIGLIFIYIWVSKKTRNITNLNKNTKTQQLPKIPLFLFFLLGSVAFIAATVGLIALIAPPNNWDSMSYHMARVVHWIQNHSVSHYPTSYLPQLYQNPWAEFTIMHFQVLSGSDRFANLVQWFSMVGSIIGVSLIAKQLGADLRGQIFSAVVAATLPMGILQGSSTQNDYAVTFWLLCFVYYVLLTVRNKNNLNNIFFIGASLGLAIFTKGTGYIYAFPFCLWFFVSTLKFYKWQSWKPFLLVFFLVFIINVGHYMRNIEIFGWPFFVPPEYKMEGFSILTFISNVIKNIGLHMAIPLDIVNNDLIERTIRLIHTILGVDINDPRTTSSPEIEFSIQGVATFEDSAGNPIHFFLIVFTIALFITRRSLRRQRYLVGYLVAVVGSFLLFCLLIKWQPWQSRLHLSIFLLFSAFSGVVLSDRLHHKIANYIAVFIIVSSLLWVFYNESRPIIADRNIFNTSRIEQYFSNRIDIKDSYVEAVNQIKSKGCRNIGLYLRTDAWEYPFWVIFHKTNTQPIHLEHINVKNVSAKTLNLYPYNNFIPCAILAVDFGRTQEIVTKNGIYVKEWSSVNSRDPVIVLLRQ